jgi:formimidoylglutamate deiminase
VGLCPSTEANLGDGIFAAPRYVDAGGSWGIGSDSHATVDVAEELRLLEYSAAPRAAAAQRARAARRRSRGRLWLARCAGGARPRRAASRARSGQRPTSSCCAGGRCDGLDAAAVAREPRCSRASGIGAARGLGRRPLPRRRRRARRCRRERAARFVARARELLQQA